MAWLFNNQRKEVFSRQGDFTRVGFSVRLDPPGKNGMEGKVAGSISRRLCQSVEIHDMMKQFRDFG